MVNKMAMMWLNYTNRRFILSGKLKDLIERASLKGLNFSTEGIEKRVARSNEYDRVIQNSIKAGRSVEHTILDICLGDVRRAANQFIFVYQRSHGSEGYVSIGISSEQIKDTPAAIDEGRFLWKEIKHKNIMIEVPAIKSGLPVIEQLTTDGIPVKVSSLFSVDQYRAAVESYISGLERRAEKREALGKISSVASFNLGAMDEEADAILEKIVRKENHQSGVARQMLGKVAHTIAWMFYHVHQELFSSSRFMALMKKGAKPQQLLWDYSHSKKGTFKDMQALRGLQASGGAAMVCKEVFVGYQPQLFQDAVKPEDAGIIKWRMYQIEQILEINLADFAKKLEQQARYAFNMYSPSMIKVFKEKINDLKFGCSDKNGVLDINPPLINIPVFL